MCELLGYESLPCGDYAVQSLKMNLAQVLAVINAINATGNAQLQQDADQQEEDKKTSEAKKASEARMEEASRQVWTSHLPHVYCCIHALTWPLAVAWMFFLGGGGGIAEHRCLFSWT